MKRKAFLPIWDSLKPKMTTTATLGLGKNCPHSNNSVIENLMIDKKKNQIVMNNLSSNFYEEMLNNKLKRRLFSKSKLRGCSIFNY